MPREYETVNFPEPETSSTPKDCIWLANRALSYVYPDIQEFDSDDLIILESGEFDEKLGSVRENLFHPTLLAMDTAKRLVIPFSRSYQEDNSNTTYFDRSENKLYIKTSIITTNPTSDEEQRRETGILIQELLKSTILMNSDKENLTGENVKNAATKLIRISAESMLQRTLPWNKIKELQDLTRFPDFSANIQGGLIEFRADEKVALPYLGIGLSETSLSGIIAGPQEIVSNVLSRAHSSTSKEQKELENYFINLFSALNLYAVDPDNFRFNAEMLADKGIDVVGNPRKTFDAFTSSSLAEILLDKAS